MNAHTESLTLHGPAGAIEALLDRPEADLFETPRGTVVIAHPHPQFGGTLHNKVVQTIARACGKAHVTHLEPEDLVAVSIEAAAMARVPLAGTSWIPGHPVGGAF